MHILKWSGRLFHSQVQLPIELCTALKPVWSIEGESTNSVWVRLGVHRVQKKILLGELKVLTVKSRTKTHLRQTLNLAIQSKLVCQVWRTDKCLFLLDFRSYVETFGPLCFEVLCKIILIWKFISKSISWSPKRLQKQSKQLAKFVAWWRHCGNQPT